MYSTYVQILSYNIDVHWLTVLPGICRVVSLFFRRADRIDVVIYASNTRPAAINDARTSTSLELGSTNSIEPLVGMLVPYLRRFEK